MGLNALLVMAAASFACPPFGDGTTVAQTSSGGGQQQVCTSRECISASNSLFRFMNRDADPCKDFFEYACGSFMKNAAIPDGERRVHALLSPLYDANERQMKGLLEAENDNGSFETDKKLRDFYKSCANETRLERLGLGPMKKVLRRLGGWPVLTGDEWDGTNGTWHELLLRSVEMGLPFDFVIDFKADSDKMILSPPSLRLYRRLVKVKFFLEGAEILENMVDVAKKMGADEERAQAEMNDAFLFAESLERLTDGDSETASNKPKTLRELDGEKLPHFPPSFKDFLSRLFEAAGAGEVDLTDDDTVVVSHPEFVRRLSDLLAKTDRRTVANYIGWRVLWSKQDFLPERARGVDAAASMSCLKRVGVSSYDTATLNGAASSLYVRSYWKPQDKRQVLEIAGHVRAAFGRIIDGLEWMDAATKSKARKKLEAMGQVIGYPDELLCMRKVDGFFEGLEVWPDSFLENDMSLNKFWRRRNFQRLKKKENKRHWTKHMNAISVGAFYISDANLFRVPAGMLHGLSGLYGPNAPKYLGFAAIGALIGHEIGHGFDNDGRKFDHEGKLNNWWSPEADKEFMERSECVIEQYNRYNASQVGLTVDGRRTLGEILPTLIGLKAAYMAYDDYVKRNGPEPLLVGHEHLSDRQLFWIRFAHGSCDKFTDWYLTWYIMNRNDPPPEFDLRGSLENSVEFPEAFKCAKGSPMNPVGKCQFW